MWLETINLRTIPQRCQSFKRTHSEHVVTFLIHFVVFFWNVELSEKVESHHRVEVDNDGQQHDGEGQLLAVVRDGFQDDPEGSHSHGHVQQVGGKEEVVVVAQDGEDQVQQLVDERLKWKII